MKQRFPFRARKGSNVRAAGTRQLTRHGRTWIATDYTFLLRTYAERAERVHRDIDPLLQAALGPLHVRVLLRRRGSRA